MYMLYNVLDILVTHSFSVEDVEVESHMFGFVVHPLFDESSCTGDLTRRQI